MGKHCKCGSEMIVRFHTIIYQNTVEIENVPVVYCETCNHSEVLPEVKTDLVGLIDQLGNSTDKKLLHFNDISELTRLLIQIYSRQSMNDSAGSIIEERINELLDMLLLSQSLNDARWIDDIRNRLVQLTKYYISSHN